MTNQKNKHKNTRYTEFCACNVSDDVMDLDWANKPMLKCESVSIQTQFTFV